MPRDREHLPLPVASTPLARRKRPAPAKPRGDRQSHGAEVLKQVQAIGEKLRQRATAPLIGLNPANIFRIHMAKGRALNEDSLRLLGLSLLAIQNDKAFVVSTEDISLPELQRRVLSYSGGTPDGPKYVELDAIESLSVLEPSDRIGPRLKLEPPKEGEIIALDVELWHWDSRDLCRQRLNELRVALAAPGMGVPDHWIGDGIFLARIKTDAAHLEKLLEWSAIKQIERRPRPTLALSDYFNLSVADIAPKPLPPDAVGILIFDSGIASLHPLLEPALADAQVFPEAFRTKLGGSAADEHGHGTAVAGIAVYGNLADAVRTRDFQPTAQLFSARVLDRNNHYDEDSLIETQLEAALDYFFRNYPKIRVVNLSLGSSDDVLTDSRYQMRFAAVLDELARRHQDREVVFIVAAGNIARPSLGETSEVIAGYPASLLNEQSRITDPASSALALTVGGLSAGLIDGVQTADRIAVLVSGQAGNPSPFTRTGPGLNGAIKPELVEEAGDYYGDAAGILRDTGVLTANREFATSPLLKPWLGTSFAAPKVANIAAQITREYPQYSSNLIRALLVHSAKQPESRPGQLATSEKDALRVYGYGKPDLERALRAAGNDAWLIQDGLIAMDTFTVFELPSLPEAFVNRKGKRRIAVTVAFDPPTRASRADSYIGLTLDFALWRNVDLEKLCESYRNWDRDEKAELDEDAAPPGLGEIKKHQVILWPKANARKTSTVQHASVKISRSGSYVADTPLYLVLICQRKWASSSVENQRYGVVMSLFHEDETVDLQAQLRIQPKLQARARG